jgi:ABC-type multidrug transport system fused ATPase/permease subunit
MADQKGQAVRTVPAGDIKPPWEVRPMPDAPPMDLPHLMQWAGPAVILGALSVGGFEAYQAGYVAANKWVGIYWVYVVSCFFQLLMNNEIARYTIATGETALQGFTRLKPAKFWGWATAILCIVQQGWPAWIGGAAAGVAALFGIAQWQYIGMLALGAVFFVFAGSKRVYNTLEYIMYAAFVVANAGLAFLTVFMTNWEAVREVTWGWVAVGTIPAGITLTAVGPFLNQPAGGFWNFWHTYWVREKGMGMAHYFGHVTGLTAPAEEVRRTGFIFDTDNPGEVEKFYMWLKMNTVTLAVFFVILGGILFTYFAALAGYSAAVIYKMQVPSGIKIATVMAEIFKSAYGQFGFVLFCIILIFALFDSQFSVYDGIARMFADVVAVETNATDTRPYRFWYFLMMGILCAVGMITVWMRTPYILWVIINWAGVAVHAALTLGITYLNWKLLPARIKPARWIIVANIVWSIILFFYFAAWTIYDNPLGLNL